MVGRQLTERQCELLVSRACPSEANSNGICAGQTIRNPRGIELASHGLSHRVDSLIAPRPSPGIFDNY